MSTVELRSKYLDNQKRQEEWYMSISKCFTLFSWLIFIWYLKTEHVCLVEMDCKLRWSCSCVAFCYHSQENADYSTKVYVGGIPYYSTEDDIRSFFESCGTITEVDCMTFPDSGKFRGIAIISFKVRLNVDFSCIVCIYLSPFQFQASDL